MKNATRLMLNNIQQQVKGAAVAPLIISGKPGTGKSSTVRQLVLNNNYNIVEYSSPTISLELYSGLPSDHSLDSINDCQILPLVSDVKGTVWSIPEIIVAANTAASNGRPTVLLLDDFHAMPMHVQPYNFQLLLERRLGNYRLSPNVAIIGTMNDSTEAGFRGLNSAIRNRVNILQTNFQGAASWLENVGANLHYLIKSFLTAKNDFILEDESAGIEGFGSPRAWTSLSEELTNLEEDFIVKNARALAAMQVSSNAAQAFEAHVLKVNAIDFQSIVTKRDIIDISEKDVMEAFLLPYIVNFITTIGDGEFLLKLIGANITDRSFVGFVISEVHTKFLNRDKVPLTEGLALVLDKLLDQEPDPEQYKNINNAKKALDKDVEYLDEMLSIAASYL